MVLTIERYCPIVLYVITFPFPFTVVGLVLEAFFTAYVIISINILSPSDDNTIPQELSVRIDTKDSQS